MSHVSISTQNQTKGENTRSISRVSINTLNLAWIIRDISDTYHMYLSALTTGHEIRRKYKICSACFDKEEEFSMEIGKLTG